MDKLATTKFSSADVSVLKKLLLFTVAMFVFPISIFFILQKAFPKDRVVLPVVASIITVHIIIAIYVWMAWNEGNGDENEEELKED